MSKLTFRGGVHPEGKKSLSKDVAFRVYDTKGEIVLPLSMHIGKPSKPIVKKNDVVLVGQMIAEADGFISASLCSPCSGKIKAIEKRVTCSGTSAMCIVIDNDGEYNTVEGYGETTDYNQLSKEEILKKVKDAGIVGMGGAGFPTNVKLAPKNPDQIHYIIANGAECEPYITCDDRLMQAKSVEIVTGLKVILKLFPYAQAVIAIEDNKPEAIKAMTEACSKDANINVVALKTKYPQGGERSLIKVIADCEIKGTMLPADAGCIVDNVGTIYAVYNAVVRNIPLVQRAVTVTGEGVKEPCNLIARIGTKDSELLEQAGGFKEGVQVKKVLCGGPMMGTAVSSLDSPFEKRNNALTFMVNDEVEESGLELTACIRCGRCNRVCPFGLVPQQMSIAVERGDYDRFANKLYGMECVACGTCTFICPAKRPLTQLFKQAKAEVMAIRRAEQLKEGGKK